MNLVLAVVGKSLSTAMEHSPRPTIQRENEHISTLMRQEKMQRLSPSSALTAETMSAE
jgi:hypothetical protein